MTRSWMAACLILSLMLLGGCAGCFGSGGDDEQAQEESTSGDTEQPENLGEALDQASRAMQDAFGGGEEGGAAVEPVDFRKLKDLLPESVAGIDRTSSEGQKSGVMGIKMSQAEATYQGDDASIEISIIDMGTLKGAAMLGYAWLMAEIDRESDSGFERTTKYRGSPAYEKCERQGERMDCETQVVIGQRFIVSVKGRGVTMDQIEEAREEVPMGTLERMKNEGA